MVLASASGVAHGPFRSRPVQVRIGVIRIQPDGLAAILDRALVVVKPQPGISSSIQRQRMLRIDLKDLIEGLHGLLEIFLLRQIAALAVEPVSIANRL